MAANVDQATTELDGRLRSWLRQRHTGLGPIQISQTSRPEATGFSNQTVLFDLLVGTGSAAITRKLVLRIQQPGAGVYPKHDVETHFRLMSRLAESGSVPVPRPLWFESDPEVLGSPFFVMEQILGGRVPNDDPPFTFGSWVWG